MEFQLPKIGKPPVNLPHFPTRWQAFLFRAWEYVPAEKIAFVLDTDPDTVRAAAAEMGLPPAEADSLWRSKGYITIIRRMWHILPYEQLLTLLDMDRQTLAVTLREDDFLDIKLGEKPNCAPVRWRPLTDEEGQQTARISEVMKTVSFDGAKPFDFHYDVPVIRFSGEEKFATRMIYAFSGLYQHAFDVDSREFCPDEMLRAYADLGVNAVWTQGILFQLTEFPFAPELSEGWQERICRMKDFAARLKRFGMKLFLYLNEPRSMPASFFETHPHLKGHVFAEDKICLCTSAPEIQAYLADAVESVCRAVPEIGGFFTITRSENPTNCCSHSVPGEKGNCTCPRCRQKSIGEVIGQTVAAYRRGADRVDPSIKIMAWSWGWGDFSDEIIAHLPERTILLSQSELAVPFEIGGIRGLVRDYSMSIIGPGENARWEWKAAAARGLETAAKVQISTTWEGSTVPALPVYPLVDRHIRALREEGVSHLLLSWTLGGYPSRNIAQAARYFYEKAETEPLSPALQKASEIFAEAFCEFPFDIGVLYRGPQNAGPSNLLYPEPTGYTATMTGFAYDDLKNWRSIYPEEVFETQFEKLCRRWEDGLRLLEDEPRCETVRMAEAAYAVYYSCLCQIRFLRAREKGDTARMREMIREEEQTARMMLALMNEDASIGYEAANHYYFSKYQMAEKILSCRTMDV